VRESGIHNVGIRNPEHEFAHTDSREKSCLTLEALVGCALEFEKGI